MKDEFDALLERSILAHGFLRLRCRDCGHDKLVGFSCILEAQVIERILTHLGLQARAPPRAPASRPTLQAA